MAKTSRIHAPGCIFHITARTQGHRPWFTETQRELLAPEIVNAARSAGMTLIAFAIMTNHFHIVIRQGVAPLGQMMHRVMHRAALILKRAHKLQGHVFERRYWSGLCGTPEYVRRAIVYTHLNPWRAALCDDPAEYKWSTHSLYVLSGDDRARTDEGVAVFDGLRFFAHALDADDSLKQYIDAIRFQMSVDRFLCGEQFERNIIAPHTCDGGDQHWFDEYASATQLGAHGTCSRPIFDVAQKLLAQIDSNCPLDLIRTNSRARKLVAIRRNLALALVSHGYNGVQISRFLGISGSCVSSIKALLRN